MSSATTAGTVDRGATRDAWNRIATGYDRYVTPSHEWLGSQGLQRAGLQPGMRFLDVAAGSGALSLPAARLGADVLSTDVSPVMLEQLAARARREHLAIDTRVMDGHALDLEDGTFDVAGSQFGVMLFPDMPKGVRELARVTRPGGRVLLTVFGDPRRIEFFQFFLAAIRAAVPGFTGPPMDPPILPFQLQDPARVQRELEAAGLRDVRVEQVTEQLEFPDGEALWHWLLNSNPVPGDVLAQLQLAADQITVIRESLDALVRERRGHGSCAVLTNPVNIGIGTR